MHIVKDSLHVFLVHPALPLCLALAHQLQHGRVHLFGAQKDAAHVSEDDIVVEFLVD